MYLFGFGLVLFAVALFGRAITSRLGNFASEEGWFKKILGMLCIVLAIGIGTGATKNIESFLIDKGFTGLAQIEQSLLKQVSENQNHQQKDHNPDQNLLSY